MLSTRTRATANPIITANVTTMSFALIRSAIDSFPPSPKSKFENQVRAEAGLKIGKRLRRASWFRQPRKFESRRGNNLDVRSYAHRPRSFAMFPYVYEINFGGWFHLLYF